MKESTATSDASPIRGFAWHVYPDPASPGALEGDSPFNPGESRGPDRPPLESPPGIAAFYHGGNQAQVTMDITFEDGRKSSITSDIAIHDIGRPQAVRRAA